MVKDFGSWKLPRFKAGSPLLEQITAERMNDICSMIEACRLQSGVGYTMNRTPGGTVLTILGDDSNIKYIPPLNAIYMGLDGENIRIRIKKGFVNQTEPKIGTLPISAAEAFLTVPKSFDGYIYIKVTDPEPVEGVETPAPETAIIAENSTNIMEDTATQGYIRLARLTLDSNGVVITLNNYLTANLQFQHCEALWWYWVG